MVTNVDSYWFGSAVDLESSLHSQVQESSFSGENGAMALSWRDRIIPSRTRVVLSTVMTWGEGADRPEVDLGDLKLPDEDTRLEWEDTLSINGTLKVASGGSAQNSVVYLVVDGEVLAEATVDSSGGFTISFTPSALRLSAGSHEFRIYAIDGGGAIVPITAFKTTILAPTESQSGTPVASGSPTASATPSASWGEIIDLPWYEEDSQEARDDAISPVTIGKLILVIGLPVGVLLVLGFGFLTHRYRMALRADMMQRLKSESQTDPSSTGMGI
jgi:hypothetical protein